MAVIHPPESLLASSVNRLRRMTVNDWVKLGISIAGFAIVTWSTVQNLAYRVDKIEDNLETHLTRHDSQFAENQATLKRIEIELARIQK